MNKFFSKFQNSTAYNAAKSSLELPHVSLIDTTSEVKYDPTPASVGDYLFSDLNYSSSLVQGKTPIAVCVAPASHFSNGKARWMSLVNMSATDPEQGTTTIGNDSSTNSAAGFCWGASSIPGLTASDEVPTLICSGINQPTTSLSESPIDSGYIPSDHFNLETINVPIAYPLDSNYSYFGNDRDLDGSNYGAIPSPFNQDRSLNPWARLYALQYENGKSMTAAIMTEVTKYSTGEITRDDSTVGSYPAAIACSRFHTSGTRAGDWYLPSIAELMYVAVNLDLINSKLNNLGNNSVKVGDNLTADNLGTCLWSSSIYANPSTDYFIWILDVDYCIACGHNSDDNDVNSRVRAFLEY